MRTILTAIIFCIFLPVLTFAAESHPSQLQSASPLSNVFEFLRGAPAKIESYITPESAKEKGFWAWIQETSGELFSRAIHAAISISEFIKNKGQMALDFIEIKIKEKIGENIWQSGEQFIKNSINYIDKKIQN